MEIVTLVEISLNRIGTAQGFGGAFSASKSLGGVERGAEASETGGANAGVEADRDRPNRVPFQRSDDEHDTRSDSKN